MYLYFLAFAIFVANVSLMLIIIYLTFGPSELHVELENHVKIFPTQHYHMGDVIVRSSTETYGIIDGKSFDLTDVSVNKQLKFS